MSRRTACLIVLALAFTTGKDRLAPAADADEKNTVSGYLRDAGKGGELTVTVIKKGGATEKVRIKVTTDTDVFPSSTATKSEKWTEGLFKSGEGLKVLFEEKGKDKVAKTIWRVRKQ